MELITVLTGLVTLNLGVSIVNARQLGHDQTARGTADAAEQTADDAEALAEEALRSVARHERQQHEINT